MYRTILCVAAGAVIFAMPAKADEVVKWRHVHHISSLQSLQVGDVNGHTLNLYRLPGIAFFPDGSTGTTTVIGTSDFLNGSNTTNGSALWLKYTGMGTPTGNGTKVAAKGTAIVIGGKGRYADAKGEGTFEGESTQPGPEGIQYIDNVINIKK
jgi:hypothetical protein